MRILATAIVAACFFCQTTFAQHFEQIPDFRALYPIERQVIIGPAETAQLPSGDIDLLWIDGTCTVPRTGNIDLRVREIVVTPTGHFDCGTPTDRVTGSVTITFADGEFHESDVAQWGFGLLCFGKLSICGLQRETWIEATETIPAGATSIPVGSGWLANDKINMPDMAKRASGAIRNIAVHTLISSTGQLHNPVDFNRTMLPESGPLLANLTKNIAFTSENINGLRGHSVYADGADVILDNASFVGMGRTKPEPLSSTNLVGRYPVHFHHTHGVMRSEPSDNNQFICRDVVVDGVDYMTKWGIVVHRSHWGLVENCVSIRTGGAGFVTEDGVEVGNRFKHCLAFDIRNYLTGNVSGTPAAFFRVREGASGSGFWFKGICNYIDACVSIGNTIGIQTAITSRELSNIATQESLPIEMVPAFPGGPKTVGISIRHTTLSCSGNRFICNASFGYDSWGSQDVTFVADEPTLGRMLKPTGLPVQWNKCVFAYNGSAQVINNTTKNSNVWTDCIFAGPSKHLGRTLLATPIGYHKQVYLDGCVFRDYGIGTGTGAATIIRNTRFENIDLAINGSAVESALWAYGLTLENNSYSADDIQISGAASGPFSLPEGFTVDDIPPCFQSLEEIYANVAAFRAQFGVASEPIPPDDSNQDREELEARIAATQAQIAQLQELLAALQEQLNNL